MNKTLGVILLSLFTLTGCATLQNSSKKEEEITRFLKSNNAIVITPSGYLLGYDFDSDGRLDLIAEYEVIGIDAHGMVHTRFKRHYEKPEEERVILNR